MHLSTAHGLRIACDFEVPDFDPIEENGAIDVSISKANLTDDWIWPQQRDGWINVTDNGQRVRIDIPDCAHFLIIGGHEIRYAIVSDPVGGMERVKAYLLGRVLSAILYQRGHFPLHASCIELDGRAWLFAGESGLGKSTLCQYLQERGYHLIADDITRVDLVKDGAVAWPGIRRTKLWSETLEWFGHSDKGLEPVEEQVGKFHMKRKPTSRAGIISIEGIVLLRPFSNIASPAFQRLKRLEALDCLTKNNYLWPFVPTLKLGPAFLRYAIALENAVPFFALERPDGLDQLEATEAALIELQTAIS